MSATGCRRARPPLVSDLRDWSNDAKNHGPYPSFAEPGSYTLTTPPLRPGNIYYLGFYAAGDSRVPVTNSTNGGSINYTSTLAFYGGYTTNQIPGFGQLKFRIDVRRCAGMDSHRHLSGQRLAVPRPGQRADADRADYWSSINYANLGLDTSLENAAGWPWLPGYSYFLSVTNTSASTQPFSLLMSGVYPEAGGGDGIHRCPVAAQHGSNPTEHAGQPGWTYNVLVSEDLTNWLVLGTFTPTSGTFTYPVTPSPNYNAQFFRLVTQ